MPFYRQKKNLIRLYFLALLLIHHLFSKSVCIFYLCKCAFLFVCLGVAVVVVVDFVL